MRLAAGTPRELQDDIGPQKLSKSQIESPKTDGMAPANRPAVVVKKGGPIYFQARCRAEEELELCVNWCLDHNKKEKASTKALAPKLVDRNRIKRALAITLKRGGRFSSAHCRDLRKILTVAEEKALGEYVKLEALKDRGVPRKKLSDKVVEILQLRLASAKKGGRAVPR